MQITPVEYPHPSSTTYIPNSGIHRQQLTPAPSLIDEPTNDLHPRTHSNASNSSNGTVSVLSSGYCGDKFRGRIFPDSEREDDYYFYHTGRMSRRSSIQSLGRRDDPPRAPAQQQHPQQGHGQGGPPTGDTVRLPPITSLLASVERTPRPTTMLTLAPQYTPPQHPTQYDQREYPYQSPTSYPHIPHGRRQSIFSTYSQQTSPRTSYTSHPHRTYRTPSPPYRPYPNLSQPPHSHPSHPHHPHSVAGYHHLQPRPPPSYPPTLPPTFAQTHRTNSASPAERYMCHECNKSFSRPSSLRIHTFSHTGEKPFVCPEPGCTKRFSVRSNMRRHMKVHSELGQAGSGKEDGEEGGFSEEEGAGAERQRQGSRSSI